jgi:PAT family beta-lactamase induction signal transducer AmpG
VTLRRKLSWIAVLYFAQGLPFGLAYKVWPVYFRLHGVALAEIGLLSLLFLPYTLKPAWAPLVDRFGPRQHWVALCLVALAGCTLGVALLDDSLEATGLTPWVWAVLLGFTLASATQDIAIDGYAVDLATEKDTGPINGLRVAAYRVALMAGGGLLLVLADHLPWRALWVGTAAVFVTLAVLTLLSPRVPRERSEPGDGRHRSLAPKTRRSLVRWRLALLAVSLLAWAGVAAAGGGTGPVTLAALVSTLAVASFLDPRLLAWIGRREMAAVLLLALFYKLGDNSLGRMVEPFWVDRGYSPTEIGLVSSTLGSALTIVGALAGGAWVAKRGIFSGLLWFGVAQAVSNFGYVAVALLALPRESIYAASVVESLTQGLGTAAFLSFLMAQCDKEHGATEFALLTGVYALSRDFVGAYSGEGVEALGYGGYFAVTALLALPGLALLPWVRERSSGTDAPLAHPGRGS